MTPFGFREPHSRTTLVAHLFVDDSGDFGGTGFFCLAGFVANVARWNSFQEEWRALLEKRGFPYFHTTDFFDGRPPYPSRTNLDSASRRAIASEFAAIIRKYPYGAFSVGIDGNAYKAALSGIKHVPADVFCFERLLGLIHLRMREWNIEDVIEITVDDGTASQRYLSAWQKLRGRVEPHMVAAITFANDEFVPAVQAADFLANGIKRGLSDEHHIWGIDDSPWLSIFQSEADPTYGPFFEQEYWNAEGIERRKDELRHVTANRPNVRTRTSSPETSL